MSRKVSLLLNKLASLDASSPEFVDLTKQIVSAHKEVVKQKEERELAKALEPPKPKEKKVVLCSKCGDEVKEGPKPDVVIDVVEVKPKKVKKASNN